MILFSQHSFFVWRYILLHSSSRVNGSTESLRYCIWPFFQADYLCMYVSVKELRRIIVDWIKEINHHSGLSTPFRWCFVDEAGDILFDDYTSILPLSLTHFPIFAEHL